MIRGAVYSLLLTIFLFTGGHPSAAAQANTENCLILRLGELLDVHRQIVFSTQVREKLKQAYFRQNKLPLLESGKRKYFMGSEIYGQVKKAGPHRIETRLDHPGFDTATLVDWKGKKYDEAVRALFSSRIFSSPGQTRLSGHYFQREGYDSAMLLSMKQVNTLLNLPPLIKNSYRDYYDTLLTQVYQTKLGLNASQIENLKQISLSDDLLNRTYFKAYFKDRLYRLEPHPHFDYAYFPMKETPRKFDFTGGYAIVTSQNSTERLPLEILNQIKIDRASLGKNSQVGIAEIGRLISTADANQSIEFAKSAAIEISSMSHPIQYVIIETDLSRKRLFQKFGFKEVTELKNLDYYKSGNNFVMIASLDEFIAKSFKLKIPK